MTKKDNITIIIILALILIFTIVAVIFNKHDKPNKTADRKNTKDPGYIIATKEPNKTHESSHSNGDNENELEETPLPVTGEDIKVHFIDCSEKADSIFIESGGKTMLIDAGLNKNGKQIVKYVEQLGYDTIDILVGTHPDKDHIGGIDTVIKNLNIKEFYMPDVIGDNKEYRDVVKQANKKGLRIQHPYVGQKLNLGESEITFLTPLHYKYEDSNNFSIVVRLRYGETSFLFTGDILNIVEEELLAGDFILSSDVLKVSYHGRDAATSMEFIKAVNPDIAVIFCNEIEDDSAPSKNTIKRLESNDVVVLRTDLDGTIICTSDGKDVKCQTGN